MPGSPPSQYCIPFAECAGDMVDVVGGKNASLGELVAADMPVPPGFAVTTEFYRTFLERNDLADLVSARTEGLADADEDTIAAAAEELRDGITSATVPEDLEAAVREAWADLQARSEVDRLEVAVRSSATAEDLPEASFAGQHDTYLNVVGVDRVLDRIRACMASLFTARAIKYRTEHDIDHTYVAISVGVQRMVDARVSGVMFTLNPSNGDRSKVRIEANWGLGEAVVSGAVTPDSYLVDKPTYTVVERTVAEKSRMMVPAEDGVETVDVPEDRRSEPCLDDQELEELAKIGKRLERHFGGPQDIEWVIDESLSFPENVFVVQSRPETTWQ